MENYVSVLVKVASFSFQIAGAAILLLWAVGSIDAKIKSMCLENNGMLIGEFDELGTSVVLDKSDLQKNAVTVYRNIVALIDVIIGYTLAIFVLETSVSNWIVLCGVIVLTAIILGIELMTVSRLVRHKYPSNMKVPDNLIPNGTLVMRQIETE